MSNAAVPFSPIDPEVSGSYQLDPLHSRIGFVARHAMVTKVRGNFNEFEGTLILNAEKPAESSAALSVQAASVDTRSKLRDDHLRTGDLLDADTFPQLTFTSTAVEQTGDTRFRMTGDLTIRGVTRPVDIDWEYGGTVKDLTGSLRSGFEGKAEIARSDFGMEFNMPLEAGGFLVSDKIVLELDVSAVKD
ncbi:YceI family protein [Amycolatopsis sp. WQ 127309]|uniref:YceI family protein n=1 Tax=Amycolatopsis sp. WQ 127309 TaxID=2932773 RepID=UPI001FF60B90|nr:YceI family protein [Amycolatopsis sp. WQ 127309]UOZ02749.1 YceI family protein [Amycolatopsis sp. WQ 127309]